MAVDKEVMLFGRYPVDDSRLIRLTQSEPDAEAEDEGNIQVADTAALRREVAKIKKESVI
ncbi:MAG: hypothetical protein LBL05_04070 [Synergistaceae bacterium]|nr:hypothetical protein [Synergistaceae bacterium]